MAGSSVRTPSQSENIDDHADRRIYIVNRQPKPGGPFGAYWLSLSKIHYGIHGTNNPSSIGKAVSKGCIRMYNQDVTELAATVPNGTRVTIIR